MTEARISPAPWAATISTLVLNGKIVTVGDINPEGPYRGSVARLQSAEHIAGIGAAEVIANAHLIAAAPDLYAALELALSYQPRDDSCDTWASDARAAIAKARGQA